MCCVERTDDTGNYVCGMISQYNENEDAKRTHMGTMGSAKQATKELKVGHQISQRSQNTTAVSSWPRESIYKFTLKASLRVCNV